MRKILNPRELLAMAIRIEENGFDYYSKIAEGSKNPEAKTIFTALASAEKQHISDFRKIEKSLSHDDNKIPEEYKSEDMGRYLDSFSDSEIFKNLRSTEKVLQEVKTDKDAIRHAISFEKDSIMLFHEIYDMLPFETKNRGAVGELIKQEKIHMARLYILLNELK